MGHRKMISDIMRTKPTPTARVPERQQTEPADNQPPAPGSEPAKQQPAPGLEPAKSKYYLRPRVATVGCGMCFSFGKREISRSFTGPF